MDCLLCNSKHLKEIDKAPVKKIVETYVKYYKVDFGYLFKEPDITLQECKDCGLMFYTPVVTGDDNYYGLLQKNSWYYRDEKEEYKFTAAFINEGDKVLDVGCGKGAFAKYIVNAEFTGLEFSSDAIATGRESGYNILQQSIQDHAKANAGKYDVVTLFQVLEHVSNISEFVRSSAQCVKPGGKLIIAVPSDESYLKFVSNEPLNMPPHHISRWSDEVLTKLSDQIGFKLNKIHHEDLDQLHKTAYLNTFIERILSLNLKDRAPLTDSSTLYRIRKAIANRVTSFLIKKGIDHSLVGVGQTVIGIYIKPFN